jgi:hypothetical protein
MSIKSIEILVSSSGLLNIGKCPLFIVSFFVAFKFFVISSCKSVGVIEYAVAVIQCPPSSQLHPLSNCVSLSYLAAKGGSSRKAA